MYNTQTLAGASIALGYLRAEQSSVALCYQGIWEGRAGRFECCDRIWRNPERGGAGGSQTAVTHVGMSLIRKQHFAGFGGLGQGQAGAGP